MFQLYLSAPSSSLSVCLLASMLANLAVCLTAHFCLDVSLFVSRCLFSQCAKIGLVCTKQPGHGQNLKSRELVFHPDNTKAGNAGDDDAHVSEEFSF